MKFFYTFLIVFFIVSCSNIEPYLTFEMPFNEKELAVVLVGDERFEMQGANEFLDIGFSYREGDTLILTSNKYPLRTQQKKYHFLIMRDSVCRLSYNEVGWTLLKESENVCFRIIN